ncbi:response regulator [Ulvibacter litoralis]|uniref:Response regulator receiver domain-containing protein n=1 Tax=Ulvibacter litoralis TaxID=227084 RepID=A0A1G7CM18_9FLAO|nr:response regulator [Ulvibacter litoralis]GHC47031.1 response regulator [Ulvibacter litoralis]SDE39770.1 Response regulator receiver domain-containing protein [Ulvibacter litoralis]
MVNNLSILFIEDDVVETMKMNRTLVKLGLIHAIQEAKNGEEALRILMTKENLPDIILLDLNMPKVNGLEFLKIIKADERLRYIPTIVLTTSNNHKDLLECYEIGIAGYVLKPLKYEDYVSKMEKLLAYWSVNELIKA